jgi:hypothetical protein
MIQFLPKLMNIFSEIFLNHNVGPKIKNTNSQQFEQYLSKISFVSYPKYI